MPVFSQEIFLLTLGLISAVILVSALFSGAVERAGVPQVAVFLGIGALIGPMGAGFLDAGIHSPILRVVATLSLALVLFTDAVSLDLREVRRHKLLVFLVLGPGTLLSAGFVGLLAWKLLGLEPASAAILGAALSSTDPVLLRSFLRLPGLEREVSQALRLESGMNDAVLLPVVLVAMTTVVSGEMQASTWIRLGVELLLLSPGVGVIVALAAVRMLEFMRTRTGIRRDYESLYSLGVAFAAFAAAESFHGSGFLAAFAAGLTIAALDVELCDCFLEYGETTSEMALLFTFILFGTSIVWTGLSMLSWTALLFTSLVFLARPVAFVPALIPAHTAWHNRLLIAWFGPRGLSSLLLVLLPVFGGIDGAERLVPICALVVLCSIVVHGFSPTVLCRQKPEIAAVDSSAPELQERTGAPVSESVLADPEYISIEDFAALRRSGQEVLAVDARTGRTYEESNAVPAGSVRIDPGYTVRDARTQEVSKTAVSAVLCA